MRLDGLDGGMPLLDQGLVAAVAACCIVSLFLLAQEFVSLGCQVVDLICCSQLRLGLAEASHEIAEFVDHGLFVA